MSDNEIIVNADGPAEQYRMVPIAEWGRMQARIRELGAELRAYEETEELTGKPGDGELHKRIRELEAFLRSTFDDEDITPTSLEFWSSEYKHAMRQLADAGKKDQRIRDLEAELARVQAEAKHLISPALRAMGTNSDERERIRHAINVITQNGDATMMTRDEAMRVEIEALRQQVKNQADQIVNLKQVRDNAVSVACEPWRNHDIEDAPDADSPLYWVWEAAVNSALEQAHSVLGGNFTYEGGDGGDEGPEAAVHESFRNMFVAKGIMDRETHAIATHAELARVQAEAAAMREEIKMLIDGADCHCAAAEKLGLDECAVCAANKAMSPTAGRDLLERLEKAEAIVGKLPKTEDGVAMAVTDCNRELWYIAADGKVYCHVPWRIESIPGMYSTREAAEAALKKTKEKISVIRTEFLDVCKSVAPTDAQCRYSSDSEYQRGARDLLKAMAGSVLKCFEEIEASINPK